MMRMKSLNIMLLTFVSVAVLGPPVALGQNSVSQLSYDLAANALGYLDRKGPASKNSVLSPLSVTVALGMLYEGSSGQTKQDMQRTLGFSTNDLTVRQEFKVGKKSREGQ